MTDVMLRLGEFKFGIATAAYETLKQTWDFQWASQPRIGRNPVLQFTGFSRGQSLAGVMYPGQFGSRRHIEAMVTMAGKGEPLLMVASTGVPLGYWAITKVECSNSVFFSDGEPRKIDFSLELQYFGETPRR